MHAQYRHSLSEITLVSLANVVLSLDPASRQRKWVWHTSPKILGLLMQHFQKSGVPIRLIMLADHMALQKELSNALVGFFGLMIP